MQRTKPHNKPSAILTGDWHLREDQPVCRKDNYWDTQWQKVQFIKELQKQHNCPVIHAGDLFAHWKPSPYLLSKTIENIPKEFHTIYGNHDLPQHNIEMISKCGINTLATAGKLYAHITGTWGTSPEDFSEFELQFPLFQERVLVWHVMTYTKKEHWRDPGTDYPAQKLLKTYPDYNLIVTGHNHQSFHTTYEGRLLVNPGSILRMEANQIDHKPRVYLWYADSNTVKEVFLPVKKDVISREHIEVTEKRDERIDAFISQLDEDWEAGMSFEQNLEKFFSKNDVNKTTQNIIYESIEN